MCKVITTADYLASTTDINIHESIVSKRTGEHMHEFVEVGIVIKGKGIHTINEKRFPVRSGDVFVLDPYVSHELITEEGEEMCVRNCLFSPPAVGCSPDRKDFLNEVAGRVYESAGDSLKRPRYISLSGSNLCDVAMLFDDLRTESEKRSAGYQRMMQFDLSKMLIQILRKSQESSGPAEDRRRQNRQLINQVLQYMLNNYNQAISTQLLADQHYVSVSHLNRLFKETTGKSVNQMLQDIRMKEAAKRLKNMEEPVMEVALSVGYTDMKHFYRLFHKHFGCTPKEYRTM